VWILVSFAFLLLLLLQLRALFSADLFASSAFFSAALLACCQMLLPVL
jgi:hypothetical protein